jgi:hypothetical protein
MVTLHAFLALLAGCATMVLLAIGLAVLKARLIPEWADARGRLSVGSAFVNLGCSFLAGAAGGYVTAGIVTAWRTAGSVLGFVLMLAVVALAMGGISALASRGKLPVAYLLAMAAVTPMGVVAGGLVRLRGTGVF